MKREKKYRRKEYVMTSRKVSSELCFLLLADLHGKSFGEKNIRLIEDIKKEAPDAVFIAGDMLLAEKKQCRKSMENALELCARLMEICPVYYGNGNHETKVKDNMGKWLPEGCFSYEESLEKIGVEVLSNRKVRADFHGNRVLVSGLETDRSYYKRFGKLSMHTAYLEKMLGDGEDPNLHILLAHNPHYFDAYAAWGADLTFSGHLHGGVVGWPGRGGVISPQFRLFPRYTAGFFDKKGKKLLVSRGLGEHFPPIRIFNPREYLVLRIVPEKESLEKIPEKR